MSGFDKIEFNSDAGSERANKKEAIMQRKSVATRDYNTSNPIMTVKRKKNTKPNFNFKFTKRKAIVLGVIIVLLIAISIPAYFTYQSGLKTYRQAKLISDAYKNQNVELAADEIKKTQASLKETQRNFHFLIPLKFVPLVGWYYNDADHLLNAAEHGLQSADIVTEAIEPYADVLGLKGQGSFTAGSAEERIKTAVMTTGKVTPEIDKIAASLELVQKEMDQVNPNHYPQWLFGKNIKSQLTTLKKVTDEAATFVVDARPLVKVLPSLLGDDGEKRYLILFQNDKELRATGGFITGYTIFNVNQGIISPSNNDDIYNLDASIPNKKRAAEPILKYLPGVPTFNLRDSNLSPDFIESMKTFRGMYETARLREDVDGIIAIDTSVLVSTIKVLDDQVTAGGITFTTENDPRCDCPQVIYELENNISRPVNYIRSDRKSILGDLLNAILVKALSSSPKVYWGPLLQTLIDETAEKHVLFYLYDKEAQKGLEALNAAGQIREFDGDYLHINESNFSGAKVNIFMKESVENNYEVANDGTITKKVTIHYKNPFPQSDCNLERGGLCLNSLYRDWIRIYVPEGSELIDSKGSQVKMTTYDELGKTVFEGFTTVRPQGTGEVSITYKLPFKVKSGSPLPLLIQKQPGTFDNEYTVTVNGKTVDTFPLITDKELELDL